MSGFNSFKTVMHICNEPRMITRMLIESVKREYEKGWLENVEKKQYL